MSGCRAKLPSHRRAGDAAFGATIERLNGLVLAEFPLLDFLGARRWAAPLSPKFPSNQMSRREPPSGAFVDRSPSRCTESAALRARRTCAANDVERAPAFAADAELGVDDVLLCLKHDPPADAPCVLLAKQRCRAAPAGRARWMRRAESRAGLLRERRRSSDFAEFEPSLFAGVLLQIPRRKLRAVLAFAMRGNEAVPRRGSMPCARRPYFPSESNGKTCDVVVRTRRAWRRGSVAAVYLTPAPMIVYLPRPGSSPVPPTPMATLAQHMQSNLRREHVFRERAATLRCAPHRSWRLEPAAARRGFAAKTRRRQTPPLKVDAFRDGPQVALDRHASPRGRLGGVEDRPLVGPQRPHTLEFADREPGSSVRATVWSMG